MKEMTDFLVIALVWGVALVLLFSIDFVFGRLRKRIDLENLRWERLRDRWKFLRKERREDAELRDVQLPTKPGE
jgi:hypothetical protein